jgi:hypothetical protein
LQLDLWASIPECDPSPPGQTDNPSGKSVPGPFMIGGTVPVVDLNQTIKILAGLDMVFFVIDLFIAGRHERHSE